MIQRARNTARPPRRAVVRPGPWLGIVAAALGSRLLVAWLERDAAALARDPRLDEMAAHLAHGLGFSLGSPAASTAALPPLPPLLLAGLARILGDRAEISIWLGAVLGALGALALARLGEILYGSSVGRTAGWCGAIAPLLVRGATLVQEAAFALFLVLSLVGSAAWVRAPSFRRAVATGLCLGACALSGTLALVLPVLVVAWAWRPLLLVLPPGQPLWHVAGLGLGLACALVPWTVRNVAVMRVPAPVSTSVGPALLAGHNPLVWSDPLRRGGSIDVRRIEPWASRLAELGEVEGDRWARDQALGFLRGRAPGEVATVVAARARRLASLSLLPDDPAASRPSRAWDPVAAAVEAALLVLAGWGAVRALSGPRRWFQALPVVSVGALAAASLAVSGSSRTRLGVEPLLALLAAVGLQHARHRLRLRRRGLRVLTGSASARG